jgi:hypothetical protein
VNSFLTNGFLFLHIHTRIRSSLRACVEAISSQSFSKNAASFAHHLGHLVQVVIRVSKLVTIAAGPIAQHLEEYWQLILLNLSLQGLYALFDGGSEMMEGCQFAPAPSHEAGRLNFIQDHLQLFSSIAMHWDPPGSSKASKASFRDDDNVNA